MISLALKCKPSKEVLRHLDEGIDKLASEACDLLSKVSLEDNEDVECDTEFNEDADITMVSIQAHVRKKGPSKGDQKIHLRDQRKEKLRVKKIKVCLLLIYLALNNVLCLIS